MGIMFLELLCKQRRLPRCDSLLLHHERLANARCTDHRALQRTDSLQLAKQRLAKRHSCTQADTASSPSRADHQQQRDQAADVTAAVHVSSSSFGSSSDAQAASQRVVRIRSKPMLDATRGSAQTTLWQVQQPRTNAKPSKSTCSPLIACMRL